MNHFSITIILLVNFETVLAQSSVYLVEKDNSKMYVAGSIHILREQDYPLPQEYEEAYNNSVALALETNLNDANNPENMPKVQKSKFYQDGKTLKTVLNETTYSKLDSVCKQNGLNLEMLRKNKFRISGIVLTLTFKILQQIGATAEGVDKYYMNKAENDKKQFLYLESFEEQLGFIENMGAGIENEFVLYSLKDLEENKEEFVEMIEAWKKGDPELLVTQMNDLKKEFPEVYKSLIANRNNNWIPQLENYLKTSETEFVIVGAAHLYGDDGVLEQLKNKGYKISQL